VRASAVPAPCSPACSVVSTRNAELEEAEQPRREESFINLSIYKHDYFIDKLCLCRNEVINLMKIYQEEYVKTDNDTTAHH